MLANIINLLTFLCWLLSSIWLHGFTSTCTILVFILFFTILVKKIFPDNIYEIITLVIIGLIGVSWLLAGYNLLIFFLTSSFTYMILIKKEIIMKKPIFGKAKISAKSLDYSIAFFILTLIAFNGVKTNDGSYLHDHFHPIYEHTMGHSFSNSLIDAPDLSFYGKEIKWHFLSTQVSRLFETLGIGFVQSIYTVTPSIFFIILFFLFKQICAKNNGFNLTGLLFFFPLGDFTMLDRLVIFTPSLSMSSIIILLCYHYFNHKDYYIYLFLSFFLCFSKAPFFLVLIGFVFLKFILSKSNQKKYYGYIFLVQALFFLSVYVFYYNDAHTYNSWIILGSIRNLIVYKGLFHFILPLLIIVYLFRGMFFKISATIQNSDLIALSGVIGYLLLIEVTEANHIYFIIASLPFIIISMLKRNLFRSYFFLIVWLFFTLSNYPKKRSSLSRYIIHPARNLMTITKNQLDPTLNESNPPDLDSNKEDLYIMLKKITDKKRTVVWFPVIYETRYSDLSDRGYYWPDDGFFRSGISNRQFYLENMKYKGIVMEKDFSSRFASSLDWYQKFVNPSEINKKKYLFLLNSLESFPSSKKSSKVDKPLIRDKIIDYLTLGNNPYSNSFINEKMAEIVKIMKDLNNNKSSSFDNSITHIVLENGDRLKKEILINDWILLYSDNYSEIWQRSNQ